MGEAAIKLGGYCCPQPGLVKPDTKRLCQGDKHCCSSPSSLICSKGACLHEILQSQDSHAPEVRLGVVALEPDALPLLGLSLQEWRLRTQEIPKAEETSLMLLTMQRKDRTTLKKKKFGLPL